jgi:hypothetical protein
MVAPIVKRDLALRHVLRASHMVANQKRLIEHLRAVGKPTEGVEKALETLRGSLRAYEMDLAAADKECRTLPGDPPRASRKAWRETMSADPRTSRCGLYRIKSPPPDENDVMVEPAFGGAQDLLPETAYRERGYRPPFEELPWADEFLAG